MSKLKRYQLDPSIRKDRNNMMGYRSVLPKIDMDIYYSNRTEDIPLHVISTTLLSSWIKRKGYKLSLMKSRINNYYLIITEDNFHKLEEMNRYDLELIKELV
jgi:hypothetical protein